jgi:uncharacterized membrane protein YgcG
VTFPIQVTNLSWGEITLACTVSIPATCPNLIWPISSGTVNDYVTLTVPSGAATGQFQINLTASVDGATQSYTYPFYVASVGGSLSTGSLNIANLASGKLNVTMNATAGLNATVVLGCSYQLALKCSFSPSSVPLVGGTPQTATLTITSTGLASNRESPRIFPGKKGLLLAALLPLGLLVRMRRLRFPAFFFAVVAAVSLSLVASCGSGGSAGSGGSGGTGGGGGGGSQSQTYVLTITATPNGTALSQTLGTVSVTVTQ